MVTVYFGVAVAVIQHVQGTCKNRRNVSMALFGLLIVSVVFVWFDCHNGSSDMKYFVLLAISLIPWLTCIIFYSFSVFVLRPKFTKNECELYLIVLKKPRKRSCYSGFL